MPYEDQEVLTLSQAGVYLECGTARIIALIKEGRIPAADVGKANGRGVEWRVRRADLDALFIVRTEKK